MRYIHCIDAYIVFTLCQSQQCTSYWSKVFSYLVSYIFFNCLQTTHGLQFVNMLTWTVHRSANACFAFFMNILLLHTLIMHILIEKQSFIGNTDKKSHEPLIWAVVDKANTANVNVCLCLNWSSLVQTWAVPNSEFYSY